MFNMRFQTPQFIEIEDKILGPLTLKQFIYLIGGGGLAFTIYSTFPLLIAIPIMLPVIGFSLALAFYQINNKPFIYMLEAGMRFFMGNKLYTWRREAKKVKAQANEGPKEEEFTIPKLTDSKLKELAWSLDIYDIGGQKQKSSIEKETRIEMGRITRAKEHDSAKTLQPNNTKT